MRKISCKHVVWLFSLFVLSSAISLLSSKDINAVARPANEAEKSAVQKAQQWGCVGNAFGALWVTGSATEKWNMSITVNSASNSTDVFIRGSVYTCQPTYQQAWAAGIEDRGSDLPITNLSSTSLNRGYTGPVGSPWTEEKYAGNYIKAKMDISKVPQDGKPHRYTLRMRRCFSADGVNINWSTPDVCQTQDIPVTVTRPNPVNWNSNIRSWVYVKDTNKAENSYNTGNIGATGRTISVYPGQKVRFYHTTTAQGQGIRYTLDLNGSGHATASSWNGKLRSSTQTTNFDYRAFGPLSESGMARDLSYASWEPTLNDIGSTYCQWITMSPQSSSNASAKSSSKVCVKVEAEPWQLSLKTEIKGSFPDNNTYQNKNINARVGETLNWKHTATNNTNYIAPADSTNKHGYGTLGYNLLYASTSKPTNGVASPETHWVRDTYHTPNINKNGGSYSYESSKSAYHAVSGLSGIYSLNNNGKPPTSYTIKSSDVGKNFCQRQYAGRIKDGGSEAWSDWRCAYVSYDYEITPCIVTQTTPCGGVDVPSTPGEETPPPTPTIDVPSTTKNTDWVITEWTVPGEKEENPTADTYIDPESKYKQYYRTDSCDTYDAAHGVTRSESNCKVTHSGKQIFTGTTKLSDIIKNFTLPEDAELGQRYCIALSVSPYKMTAGQTEEEQNANKDWRHGAPYCLIAMKEPKMQVWGGNLYAEKGIQTSRVFNYKGNNFGSWVEYAGLSGSNITRFGSASGPTSTRALNTALTFSNNTAQLGNYGKVPPNDVVSKLQARYPVKTTNGCESSGSSNFIVCKSNSATIDVNALISSQIATGKTVIIDAKDKTLNINSDISTKATASSLGDIQQVILIGKNINIAPSVTKIDAWLLADNSVVTCAEPKNGTLVRNKSFVLPKNCDTPLKINGPVKANALYSYRTAGGLGDQSGVPAEIYNFRADTYLWATANSTSSGAFITTYTKEISPRF